MWRYWFNNIKPIDDTIMADGEPVKIADLNKNSKKEEKKEKKKRWRKK